VTNRINDQAGSANPANAASGLPCASKISLGAFA
jgi:hypothetical protein